MKTRNLIYLRHWINQHEIDQTLCKDINCLFKEVRCSGGAKAIKVSFPVRYLKCHCWKHTSLMECLTNKDLTTEPC